MRMLEPGDRAHEIQLDVERQTRGDPVGVELRGRKALWFEEDLVRRLVRKPCDLVFDGWAIARTYTFYDSGEHRRSIETTANQLMRAFVGVCDPARTLLGMHRDGAHERKHGFWVVARLLGHDREIDRSAVDARRSPGLQASDRQRQFT